MPRPIDRMLACLLLTAGVTLGACEAPATPPAPQAAAPAEAGTGGHEMASLPVAHRVAFMSGHVTAGLALYRAGAPEEAAPHLLHPVSETHAAERAGIDALGFDPAPFRSVSAALEAGRPAAEVEPMLAAAEANIALLRRNAGGDPADIIDYLMRTAEAEYVIGVRDGGVADPGEYQDAYGFAVVALDTAARLPEPVRALAVRELQGLIALWPPGGPLAASRPAPVETVTARIARVRAAVKPGG